MTTEFSNSVLYCIPSDAGDDDLEVEADFEKEMKQRIETTTNDDIEAGCPTKVVRFSEATGHPS